MSDAAADSNRLEKMMIDFDAAGTTLLPAAFFVIITP